jgi:ketosteroid isomerase-like protein
VNRQQYLEYIENFNNKRFDKVTSYFAPDITVEYPDNFFGQDQIRLTLHSPQEFIANYLGITENTKEVLEVGDFLSEGNKVFVELCTEFITF